jgi:hypothetical protein
MASEISIEFYRPQDRSAHWYKQFSTWESALQFAKISAKGHVCGFLRIFVPPSLANNGQYNELREALGLEPVY